MNTFSRGIASGSDDGIFIGLGANLPSARFGPPKRTLAAAVAALPGHGVRLLRQSRWYRSAPMPPSDQPWFANAVAAVATELAPAELLATLHEIEHAFGRRRGQRWQARTIDLDLLDHGGRVETAGSPVLPHPRMHDRAFVMLPLRDIAPDWVHPVSGLHIDQLCLRLDPAPRSPGPWPE